MLSFAWISAFVVKKQKKYQSKHFGDSTARELRATHELQDKLMSTPILASQKTKGKYKLDTNACNVYVGYTLQQKQFVETAKPVAYWPRSLTKAERSYNTTKQKCLAVVSSVLILQQYPDDTRFMIQADHDSSKLNLNHANATGC